AVVRELVGAVSLARHGVTSSSQDFFEGLGFRSLDPLVALLMTTGAFSRGAKELAISSGIFPCDVGQIAMHLASRKIGFAISGDSVEFSSALFREWVAQRADYQVTMPLTV